MADSISAWLRWAGPDDIARPYAPAMARAPRFLVPGAVGHAAEPSSPRLSWRCVHCRQVTEMLFDIDPRTRAKVDGLVDELGESEFRRRVSVLTRYDTTTLSLDNVVCLFVAARRGRVHPPEAGRRAAALYPTLPPRTSDDAGFSDADGHKISRDEWLRRRATRLATTRRT